MSIRRIRSAKGLRKPSEGVKQKGGGRNQLEEVMQVLGVVIVERGDRLVDLHHLLGKLLGTKG
jgi:hypothetical protein